MLKRALALTLLTLSMIAVAQAHQVKGGSTVYIEPMGGYETYLAAEFIRRHVPLAIVADKSKADYVITGTVTHKVAPQPGINQATTVINNNNTNVSGNTGSGNPLDAMGQKSSQITQDSMNQYYAKIRALGETDVTIMMINPISSQILFADAQSAAGKNQFQRLAEACTKRLLDAIAKN